MTAEDFYHSKPMTFLQRLVSIGYSNCRCCGMPWNFVKEHGGKHLIMIDKYEGFFPVCEYCWTHKSYAQNKSAVTKLIERWRKQGVRDCNPNVYINAFEDDWNKTHKMEEKITAWVARDSDGGIAFYQNYEPYKGKYLWIGLPMFYAANYMFPQVKWDDDKPTEVEITIKAKEK